MKLLKDFKITKSFLFDGKLNLIFAISILPLLLAIDENYWFLINKYSVILTKKTISSWKGYCLSKKLSWKIKINDIGERIGRRQQEGKGSINHRNVSWQIDFWSNKKLPFLSVGVCSSWPPLCTATSKCLRFCRFSKNYGYAMWNNLWCF